MVELTGEIDGDACVDARLLASRKVGRASVLHQFQIFSVNELLAYWS